MLYRAKKNGALLFGAGLSAGLCVGVGMLIGSALSNRDASPAFAFPPELLQATASDSSNTMAVATGPIADNMEGFFVLDFITGNLECTVLNPRTGGPGGGFKHNVALDLGVQQGKQPRYLLATGIADFRYQGGGNVRPASCVVYVTDANTGRYAAYMLPWNKVASQYNAAQFNPMVKLFSGSARNIAFEGQ